MDVVLSILQLSVSDGSVDFADATITGASFQNADGFLSSQLTSTLSYGTRNLSRVNLRSIILDGIDFSQQDLSFAGLEEASLIHSNLKKANLHGARLYATSGADLTNANLTQTRFHESDLRVADLVGVNLRDTRMHRSIYDQWTLFPPEFDPGANNLQFIRSKLGDFNADDQFDHEQM